MLPIACSNTERFPQWRIPEQSQTESPVEDVHFQVESKSIIIWSSSSYTKICEICRDSFWKKIHLKQCKQAAPSESSTYLAYIVNLGWNDSSNNSRNSIKSFAKNYLCGIFFKFCSLYGTLGTDRHFCFPTRSVADTWLKIDVRHALQRI